MGETSNDSDITETVARSRVLREGETTRIDDVSTDVILRALSSTPTGNLIEGMEGGLVYNKPDEATPVMTEQHVERTVSSEYADMPVSVFSKHDFNVLSKSNLRAIVDGLTVGDVVLLSSLDPLKGYLCRTIPVTLVTVSSDGLGTPQTFVSEHASLSEQDQHADALNELEGTMVTLSHEDGDFVVEPTQQNEDDGLVAKVRTLVSSTEEADKRALGDPADTEEMVRGKNVASVVGDSEVKPKAPVAQSEWVTVSFTQRDDIVAEATNKDQQWVFETTDGVLDNKDDIGFFEAAGFEILERDRVDLRTASVTGPPDGDYWKLNQKGDWWLVPETI